MKTFWKIALGGALALGLPATAAYSEIVCNDEGDCWHTKTRVEYPADVRVHVHPDDWKWKETDHYRFREHEGHGYWRGGVWVDIK